MDWHRIYRPEYGFTPVIGPPKDGLKYIDFGMLRLQAGKTHRGSSDRTEVGLIIVGGSCNITANDKKFNKIGRRADFFGGKATSLYIPPGTNYEVEALTDLEIAVASVPT